MQPERDEVNGRGADMARELLKPPAVLLAERVAARAAQRELLEHLRNSLHAQIDDPYGENASIIENLYETEIARIEAEEKEDAA